MTQPNNGKIPLKSEYVIKALQEENYLLREQNITLRGMLFQSQAQAQERITSLEAQVVALQRQTDPHQDASVSADAAADLAPMAG